jgi:glycerol-3-phosphate O-acyltransferase
LLRRATDPLFRRIDVDDEWVRDVRAVAARGPVIYVLRNVSALDYLALNQLAHRLDLPKIGFVNGLPPAFRPSSPNGARTMEQALRRTIEQGQSAALFLKQAPHRIGAAPRGRRRADRMLATLLALQAELPDQEIMMMPQVFVWSQRPEKRGFSVMNTLFGPADFPGELRTGAQFVLNLAGGRLRAGEPLSLRDFRDRAAEPLASTRAEVNRLTFALLRKLERERRSIVGPAKKSAVRTREEVLRSRRLQKVIAELAGPGQDGRRLLTSQARDMLRRLQSTPDADTQGWMAAGVEGIVTKVFSGLDMDLEGLERLREAIGQGPVVLLPSHKSHIDYLVLSTALRKHGVQLPVIAAGDNLSFFPAGPILRRGGAFFIRRRFRDDRLYSAVVDAYMRRLLRDGWMIEFFLEGGRSRTGKLLPPKVGLLSMVVSAALQLDRRHVTFMPVSIGYERVMEEKAFEQELSGQKKRKEDATALLRASGVLRDRWGRVNIQFGTPLHLGPIREALGASSDPVPAELQRSIVTRLAHQVMNEINRATALTPGSLVALALLSAGRRGVSYEDLVTQCQRLVKTLLRLGARTTPSLCAPCSEELRVRALREVLKLYVKSGLIEQHVPGEGLTESGKQRPKLADGADVIFTVPSAKRLRLDLAKNTLLHLLVGRAIIAVALQSPTVEPPRPLDDPSAGDDATAPGADPDDTPTAAALPDPIAAGTESTPSDSGLPPEAAPPAPSRRFVQPERTLRNRVRNLSRLFKYEFMFRADATFDEIFDEVVGAMVADGEIAIDEGLIRPGAGHDDLEGSGWLAFYAGVLRNFLEGYLVAARSLPLLLRGPMGDKDLSSRALRVGERMFLEGDIERSEAVCRPVIANAFASFCDQGYLVRDGKQLGLAPSFRSEQAVRTVESRLAAYLPTAG